MARFDAEYVPHSAMTVFAHPDDAEFSCGATLATWARAGCDITLVLCTSGNAGTHDTAFSAESLAETRAAEQRQACEALGVKDYVCLEHNDCELQPTIELRRQLVQLLRERRPEVVICGDPTAWFYESAYINHPDHRAAATATLEAIFPCSEMELLWPELGAAYKVQAVYITGQQKPTTYIDVGAGIDDKVAALRRHTSQMGDWDPEEMVRQWAQENAKRARKVAKKARKAAKVDRKPTFGRFTSAPPSTPPGKPEYVESYRVMVLARDQEETPPGEPPREEPEAVAVE
jgi:LmbE family N-acetylglucosaminyl deacetylase